MKQSHLEELIRHITRNVIKEYTSMLSSGNSVTDDKSATPQSALKIMNKPADDVSSTEKKQLERQAELDRQKDIKQKQIELDATKKEREFNRKKLDRQNRFDIPNAQKELQQLKGAKI